MSNKTNNATDLSFDELQRQIGSFDSIPVPRNLNILFSGDSLTRFEYLDLVYFLSYEKWVNATDKPNLLVEKDFDTWNEFYNFSNRVLQPYEQCDCYRPRDKFWLGTENRYYSDKKHNNTLTFLLKFGHWSYKMSWNVSDVHNSHGPLITGNKQLNMNFRNSWVPVIEERVCKLNPKPSIFIFNEGLWKDHDLTNTTIQDGIIDALNKCNIKSLFKTTTKKKNENDHMLAEYERQLCNKTDYCMDLSWTGLVPPDYYADDAHFRPPIYSFMNLQLLSILSSVEEGLVLAMFDISNHNNRLSTG